jgi:hypothetical protein
LRRQLAPLCPVRRCLHLFQASLHHGAESLGQEAYYLRVITEQISLAIAFDPEVTGPEATQAPTSGTGTTTAPPPPAPGSSSLTWSLLGDDSDDDDAFGFSVRPSRTVSTSPLDPTSPPQP